MTVLTIRRYQIPGAGCAYGPAGNDPFPTVLLLHGSEGGWSGWSHRDAVILAAHGFLALPFSYSRGGNTWRAGDIVDVPLDKTADALRALREHSLTGKIGLYGISRGAEHALLLASVMAKEDTQGLPDAVAVHAASDYVVCGFIAADPGAPWNPELKAWTWRGSYAALPAPGQPIEIENYGGPMLLSHGSFDLLWEVERTRNLAARLRAAGHNPEVNIYDGQGHSPTGEEEHVHQTFLIDFLRRHLT